MRRELQGKFIVPLREMLVMARAHAKQELELKTEEGRKGKRGKEDGGASEEKQAPAEEEVPELSVEVMGETLPKLSHQEEIKVRSVQFQTVSTQPQTPYQVCEICAIIVLSHAHADDSLSWIPIRYVGQCTSPS